MDAAELLKDELAYFAQHKTALLEKYAGQFALVKDHRLVGTFTTFEEAYRRGVADFGTQPFLVKRIAEETREMQPALFLGLLRADL